MDRSKRFVKVIVNVERITGEFTLGNPLLVRFPRFVLVQVAREARGTIEASRGRPNVIAGRKLTNG